jgi:hypothetical protein
VIKTCLLLISSRESLTGEKEIRKRKQIPLRSPLSNKASETSEKFYQRLGYRWLSKTGGTALIQRPEVPFFIP